MNIDKIAPKSFSHLFRQIKFEYLSYPINKIFCNLSDDIEPNDLMKKLIFYKENIKNNKTLEKIFLNFGWDEKDNKFTKQLNFFLIAEILKEEEISNCEMINHDDTIVENIKKIESLIPDKINSNFINNENEAELHNLKQNSENIGGIFLSDFSHKKNIENKDYNHIIPKSIDNKNEHSSLFNLSSQKKDSNLKQNFNSANKSIKELIFDSSSKKISNDADYQRILIYSSKKSLADDGSFLFGEEDEECASIKKPIATVVSNNYPLEYSKLKSNKSSGNSVEQNLNYIFLNTDEGKNNLNFASDSINKIHFMSGNFINSPNSAIKLNYLQFNQNQPNLNIPNYPDSKILNFSKQNKIGMNQEIISNNILNQSYPQNITNNNITKSNFTKNFHTSVGNNSLYNQNSKYLTLNSPNNPNKLLCGNYKNCNFENLSDENFNIPLSLNQSNFPRSNHGGSNPQKISFTPVVNLKRKNLFSSEIENKKNDNTNNLTDNNNLNNSKYNLNNNNNFNIIGYPTNLISNLNIQNMDQNYELLKNFIINKEINEDVENNIEEKNKRKKNYKDFDSEKKRIRDKINFDTDKNSPEKKISKNNSEKKKNITEISESEISTKFKEKSYKTNLNINHNNPNVTFFEKTFDKIFINKVALDEEHGDSKEESIDKKCFNLSEILFHMENDQTIGEGIKQKRNILRNKRFYDDDQFHYDTNLKKNKNSLERKNKLPNEKMIKLKKNYMKEFNEINNNVKLQANKKEKENNSIGKNVFNNSKKKNIKKLKNLNKKQKNQIETSRKNTTESSLYIKEKNIKSNKNRLGQKNQKKFNETKSDDDNRKINLGLNETSRKSNHSKSKDKRKIKKPLNSSLYQINLNRNNSITARNSSYGLKEISKNVLKIVKKYRSTTYKEISDMIVRDINTDLNGSKDEKNIRRRIYDSLNVMKAMDIFKNESNSKKIVFNNTSKNNFLLNLPENDDSLQSSGNKNDVSNQTKNNKKRSSIIEKFERLNKSCDYYKYISLKLNNINQNESMNYNNNIRVNNNINYAISSNDFPNTNSYDSSKSTKTNLPYFDLSTQDQEKFNNYIMNNFNEIKNTVYCLPEYIENKEFFSNPDPKNKKQFLENLKNYVITKKQKVNSKTSELKMIQKNSDFLNNLINENKKDIGFIKEEVKLKFPFILIEFPAKKDSPIDIEINDERNKLIFRFEDKVKLYGDLEVYNILSKKT